MTLAIIAKTTSLEENEAIIGRGLNTFFEVGNALVAIRDNKQYKETHSTFEAYCSERWGIKKSHAYNLINGSKVIKALSTIVDVLPETEKQSSEIAKAPPEEQAEVWQQAQEETGKDQPTAKEIKEVVERKQDGKFHISSKENDWYTPPEYIESARAVMGSIDTDPASSEYAQQTVGAKTYHTEQSNGLDKIWTGNVWMNPPYSMPEIKQFIDKLLDSDYDEYIVLTNNSSDTSWFHDLLSNSMAMCFTRGRVGFINRAGDVMATRQGQTFFYNGANPDLFASEFCKYGAILNDY